MSDIKIKKGLRYPAINDMIAKADNKYALVLATAKRARRIIDGEARLTDIGIDNAVSIATAEIALDEVKIVKSEEYALKHSLEAEGDSEETDVVSDIEENEIIQSEEQIDSEDNAELSEDIFA